jgi:centrin-3
VQTCLAALGFPAKKSDVLAILEEHDQNPAEGIDYKSFEKILTALYVGRTFDDLVNRAFEVFASEGKGYITLKGLRRITKDVGQSIDDEELEDMIRMFDKNEDGVIDKVCWVLSEV